MCLRSCAQLSSMQFPVRARALPYPAIAHRVLNSMARLRVLSAESLGRPLRRSAEDYSANSCGHVGVVEVPGGPANASAFARAASEQSASTEPTSRDRRGSGSLCSRHITFTVRAQTCDGRGIWAETAHTLCSELCMPHRHLTPVLTPAALSPARSSRGQKRHASQPDSSANESSIPRAACSSSIASVPDKSARASGKKIDAAATRDSRKSKEDGRRQDGGKQRERPGGSADVARNGEGSSSGGGTDADGSSRGRGGGGQFGLRKRSQDLDYSILNGTWGSAVTSRSPPNSRLAHLECGHAGGGASGKAKGKAKGDAGGLGRRKGPKARKDGAQGDRNGVVSSGKAAHALRECSIKYVYI